MDRSLPFPRQKGLRVGTSHSVIGCGAWCHRWQRGSSRDRERQQLCLVQNILPSLSAHDWWGIIPCRLFGRPDVAFRWSPCADHADAHQRYSRWICGWVGRRICHPTSFRDKSLSPRSRRGGGALDDTPSRKLTHHVYYLLPAGCGAIAIDLLVKNVNEPKAKHHIAFQEKQLFYGCP